MKHIRDVIPKHTSEIRKRASSCFGASKLSKADLSKICDNLDEIETIVNKVPYDEPKPNEPQNGKGREIRNGKSKQSKKES